MFDFPFISFCGVQSSQELGNVGLRRLGSRADWYARNLEELCQHLQRWYFGNESTSFETRQKRPIRGKKKQTKKNFLLLPIRIGITQSDSQLCLRSYNSLWTLLLTLTGFGRLWLRLGLEREYSTYSSTYLALHVGSRHPSWMPLWNLPNSFIPWLVEFDVSHLVDK